jgi:cytidyltransferase-like protein
MKISYSFGIIDLLHYGHINTLKKAKEKADFHIFGLISDESAINWMGTLISNYDERLSVLKELKCIDEIMIQETLDPLENLKKIKKKFPLSNITLYHGDNWKVMPAQDYLQSIGGKVIYTEYYSKLKPEIIAERLSHNSNKTFSKNNILSTKADTLIT